MRKLLCTAAAFAAMTVPAYAGEIKFKPYLGFDLQRMSLSYDNILLALFLGSGPINLRIPEVMEI